MIFIIKLKSGRSGKHIHTKGKFKKYQYLFEYVVISFFFAFQSNRNLFEIEMRIEIQV